MPTSQAVSPPPRRYLDNAATSWPKPESVWRAWEQTARDNGVAAGRGGYREAVAAGRIMAEARAAAASLLGVPADRVALPASATLGLNQAIHGLLRPGDHAIATAADHNATLRPLHHLARRGLIDLTVVPCDGRGWVDPQAIATAWRPATRLVSLSQASNVTGTVQDAAAVAAITSDRGGLLLLDASQALGQVPSDHAPPADIVVAPAHKWLYGMHGLAVLFVREGLELEPLLQGGTGSASESLAMPTTLQEQVEVGTADLPAAAALLAALDWRAAAEQATRLAACRQLARDCRERLAGLPAVRTLGEDPAGSGGPPIVSFVVEGFSPAETAALLEQIAGVQVRAGFHCAAAIHDYLGTTAGGTVRVSFGPFNDAGDLDAVVHAVETLAG